MGNSKAHSTLGPSAAERWMNCPGSVALSATVPPEITSIYAAEGTVAHTLAEQLVTGKIDHLGLMGKIDSIVQQDGHDITITEDMVDGATEYDDVIKTDRKAMMMDRRKSAPIISKAEVRVLAHSVNKELWGTADYVMFRAGDKLKVYDYKYGKGVAVDPEENKQGTIYAIAVMDSMAGQAFDSVEFVIVQPRAPHVDGSVRRWTISKNYLAKFTGELKAAIALTKEPKAPIETGTWCRWCPARSVCPAMFDSVQKSAQADFSMVPVVKPKTQLPDVSTLPIEKLAKALAWEDNIVSWYEAIKLRAKDILETGGKVPGYKLVQGRSNRKWVSESQVVAVYEDVLGESQLFEKKLLSPAKLEKIVGKGKLKEGLTEKPPGRKMIAPDNDPRPVAKLSAAEDFTPIENGKKVLVVEDALEKELLGKPIDELKKIWPLNENT